MYTQNYFSYHISAAPNMPIASVDLSTVCRTSDGIDVTFNYTLNWTVPFNNFDPIHNYTITIGCDGRGCPVTLTTDNVTNSRDVSYTTRAVNVTIMVTANNTVGDSDAGIAEVVGKLSFVCGQIYVLSLLYMHVHTVHSR